MHSLRKIPFPIWLFGLSGLSLAIYLLVSQYYYRIGFPLDDAWIHQTYARNLAQFGEFSFIPGQPSAGSTSPLWSALLALGYLLRLPYLAWTFFLGWLCLWGISWLGVKLFCQITDQNQTAKIWAGVFLALEWHLVWAAGSGMETLLYGMLAMLLLVSAANKQMRGFLSGCIIGLCLWVRPDGLTLLGPALWAYSFDIHDWKRRREITFRTLLGVLVFLLPYLWFNFQLAGSLWPNTFFAKQTEYGILTQAPFIQRLWQQFQLPLVGAGALLLPGVILAGISIIRGRQWQHLGGLIWVIGVMVIYAWRLPVIYQHGRYLIPVMPVYFVYGMAGLFQFIKRDSDLAVRRVLSRAWGLAAILLQLTFLYLGAKTYAQDVAFIESEMVKTAHWVSENTAVQDVIAAHDIGALGYFSDRKLVDLAGLISPEVIPIMRDETKLAQFMMLKKVKYLVAFPGWYPELLGQAKLVFSTSEPFSLQQGGENMAVYQWYAE